MKFCCTDMEQHIEEADVILYSDVFDEYGIPYPDGSMSYLSINYCSWCGKKLPPDKRAEWFERLEQLGYDKPFESDIPKEFKSSKWREMDNGK